MNSIPNALPAGSKILFGRAHGELTLGEVVKANRERYKVRQLGPRGSFRTFQPGTLWAVPASCIHPAPADAVIPDNIADLKHPAGARVMEIEDAQPSQKPAKATKTAKREVLAPMTGAKGKVARKAKVRASTKATKTARTARKPRGVKASARKTAPRTYRGGIAQKKGESLQDLHRRVLAAMREEKASLTPAVNHDIH